jgi:hypothetical protein
MGDIRVRCAAYAQHATDATPDATLTEVYLGAEHGGIKATGNRNYRLIAEIIVLFALVAMLVLADDGAA